MSEEKINRNSEKEINTDIDFINGILKYLKDKDYVSVEVCLTDWKEELKDLVKKTSKKFGKVKKLRGSSLATI
jgi:hypothetical protein